MRFDSQRFRFLVGLILLLAGLEITITLTYLARWFGLVLMILGLVILIFTARKKTEEKEEKEKVKEEEEVGIGEKEEEKKIIHERKTLADILISAFTINGRLNILLPVLGALLILFVYAFNFYYREAFEIGVNDTITILLGATMMLYNYIPDKFHRERDFVFLFFIFLFVILVLPLTLNPVPENTNSPFVYWLLAKPTSDMLNFVGIPASVHSVPPQQIVNGIDLNTTGVWIVYKNLVEVDGYSWSPVGIGLSCTGLYSVSIFISGFISFILIEYRRFDIRVASLLTLGIFTAWFANILRMTLIVAVGSHYGREALRWTHANLGIFIFMLWVGIFWAVMFKVLTPEKKEEVHDEEEGDSAQKKEGPKEGQEQDNGELIDAPSEGEEELKEKAED
ncbi:MAG: archaeosortase/exosortase family protein [Thermoplasmata archaeon]|nr:MAG: archaeosortase/exosortase family protein [Thermoplasmata archaeon]